MKKEEEFVLDPRLDKIIVDLKDTPFDEPEIFALYEKNKNDRISVVELALAGSELKIEDFSADQGSAFFFAIVSKITNLKREDGFYKETERTKGIRELNMKETEMLLDMAKEAQEEEDPVKAVKLNDKLEKKTFELSGLKEKDLTEWEISLVKDQIISATRGANDYATGRHIKN
jgi:hypothetical protein